MGNHVVVDRGTTNGQPPGWVLTVTRNTRTDAPEKLRWDGQPGAIVSR